MSNDDLNELLALIDTPHDSTDDAQARVWERVRDDLSHEGLVAGLDSEDGETIDVIDFELNERRPKSLLWRALAAAAVAEIVIGGIGVLNRPEPGTQVATEETPRPIPSRSVPTMLDEQAACARFVSTAGDLFDIEGRVDGPQQGQIADVRTTILALEQLAIDFAAAADPDENALADLTQITGGLRQAERHLVNDDTRAAIEAIDFVEGIYRQSSLAQSGCLGRA